jgi:uncharacterized phage infection (PIP) family protein YhgE
MEKAALFNKNLLKFQSKLKECIAAFTDLDDNTTKYAKRRAEMMAAYKQIDQQAEEKIAKAERAFEKAVSEATKKRDECISRAEEEYQATKARLTDEVTEETETQLGDLHKDAKDAQKKFQELEEVERGFKLE